MIAYLGSLAILLVSAFWQLDPFTAEVVREPTLKNFQTIVEVPVYRTIAMRTIRMAAAVTIACALLAFPIAYYMARIASKRTRRLLVVAILIPLWASYLVKVYSWRIILGEEGVLNWLLEPFGLSGPGYSITGTWLVFTYLWLPYMILPIYAGLERIPASLLEASSDLGGRSGPHLRPGRAAARLPGARRRLDLHLLAHARRLHHPGGRLRARSSSATSSTTTSASRTTCRSPRRMRSCRSRSWSSTCCSRAARERSRTCSGG